MARSMLQVVGVNHFHDKLTSGDCPIVPDDAIMQVKRLHPTEIMALPPSMGTYKGKCVSTKSITCLRRQMCQYKVKNLPEEVSFCRRIIMVHKGGPGVNASVIVQELQVCEISHRRRMINRQDQGGGPAGSPLPPLSAQIMSAIASHPPPAKPG